MFSAVPMDASVGNVGISTSSYVDDSFAFISSFFILAFLFNKRTVTMTRKTVEPLTASKITMKTEAVAATPLFPLEAGHSKFMIFFLELGQQ